MSEYAAILDHVRERTGLVFPASRIDDAHRAVATSMKAATSSDVDSYLQQIRDNESAFEELIAELTVGETYFCRDADQFATLRTEILSDIARRRGDDALLRAWSAGCASGEEPYSLAILFLEQGLRFSLLATDISRRALAKALEATYTVWSLRGTEPAFRERYFDQANDRFVLHDDVRRSVRFEVLNLASDDYPSSITGTADLDLILCRNVFIYFDTATIRSVGRRLVSSLAPGGWLMIGASDPMLDGIDGLQRVTFPSGVAYRRREHVVAPQIARPAEWIASTPAASARTTVARESPAPLLPILQPQHDREAEEAIEQLRNAADAGPTRDALELSGRLIDRFPLAAELHLLQGMLLIDLDRHDVAEAALRRSLFLDGSSSIAHFTLALVLRRSGNDAAAARSFQNAIAAAERGGSRMTRADLSPNMIRQAAELALKAMAAEARS